MLIREVLGIVAAMALFLLALQPQEHAHGGRRREADDVTDVQTASVSNQPPTQTHELGSGSVAIDQRGIERFQGARCDVGSVEVVP